MSTEIMSEEKQADCEEKNLFFHESHARAFLGALYAVDKDMENRQRKNLSKAFEEKVEIHTAPLDEPISVCVLNKNNQFFNGAYLALYEDGITEVLVHLVNKCGSLTYVAKLLSHFMSALSIRDWKLSILHADADYIKVLSYDEEYNSEFAALYVGLFNIIQFVYPKVNAKEAIFVRANIKPMSIYAGLDGLELVFRFQSNYIHYERECCLKFQLKLSKLRKGVIVQAVQCFNNIMKYNDELHNCKFIQIGNKPPEYDISYILNNCEVNNAADKI